MAVTYGFFNSLNGDRTYNAEQLSSIFSGVINDGVFMSIDDALMVSEASLMTVSVGLGRAWFNNTWTNNDSELILNISESEIALDRIDTVVLEINSSDAVRENSIKIVEGTPASTPVSAVLTNTDEVHQYPLAYVYISATVVNITQANITNAIGTTSCPFVTGILETLDTDDLIAQWAAEWTDWMNDEQSEFTIWFTAMQDQLSTDAAGNLQAQIDAIDLSEIEADILALETADGILQANIDAMGVGWRYVFIPASSFTPDETDGCGDPESMDKSWVRAFDPDTNKYGTIDLRFPPEWTGKLKHQISFLAENAVTTGSVYMCLRVGARIDGQAIGTYYYRGSASAKAVSGVAKALANCAWSLDWDLGSLGINGAAQIQLSAYRYASDVTDTYPEKNYLLGVLLGYEVG